MNGRRQSRLRGEAPGRRSPPGLVTTNLERQRIDDAIRARYSASLMSDTKWRKFLKVLRTVPSIQYYIMKSIRRAGEHAGSDFLSADYTPHAYVDANGPFLLREIEFPARVAQRRGATPIGDHVQDIDALKRALERVGKFPIEITSRGLRVIGHVRSTTPG